MSNANVDKYLPVSIPIYFILLSLFEPLHGYGVMQKIEILSEGTVTIGPGTLYGALTNLEAEGLIRFVGREKRRKSFVITEEGKRLMREQLRCLMIMTREGQKLVAKME